MEKCPTNIRDAWLLKPQVFSDERGVLLETWNRGAFRALGLDLDFFQDNQISSSKNVLRGLHYQVGDAAQAKLAWVTSGSVFDVIVDLRESSPTFGQWDGRILSAENRDQLYVPAGCAHGFLVLSNSCDFHYKATNPRVTAAERTLSWNDAKLGIKWPLESGVEPILSAKDRKAPSFAECEKYP